MEGMSLKQPKKVYIEIQSSAKFSAYTIINLVLLHLLIYTGDSELPANHVEYPLWWRRIKQQWHRKEFHFYMLVEILETIQNCHCLS